MKFERGRKKNQLIWSFILKVIAGQSLVKLCFFLNKTRKENVSEEIRFRSRGDVLGTFALSLNQSGRARGSLTVGPGGPLVRFDRSPPPSLSFGRTGAELRRSSPRTMAPQGHLRAGMDPPAQGGPPRGCWVGGGGGSRRRRAPRRRRLHVGLGLCSTVVPDHD